MLKNYIVREIEGWQDPGESSMKVLITMFFRGETRVGIIFRDDQDRTVFLETLGEMSDRFDVEICTFVLMSNHYHFLLQTRGSNLSRAMQWFGVAYTRRFNNRHLRSGHLFQGRFKSILVENDAYVIEPCLSD